MERFNAWRMAGAVTRWVVPLVGAAAVGVFAWGYLNLPAVAVAPALQEPDYAWPEPVRAPSGDWMAFGMKRGGVAVEGGALSQRYRLAGTFFAYGGEQAAGAGASRKAIIDDIRSAEQMLVGENDEVGDARVERIFQDHVVLIAQGRQEELWLSFSDGAAAGSGLARPATVQDDASPQEPLEVSRFGKRVGEYRWVFQREELLKYYRELLDDPERLAAVYLSLKPDRDPASKIAGYYLGVEGEGEFFKAVGLQPGDVVRKVNSMRMTSQKRAEYFIGEFVKDRLSAVVLDIEREEKPQKLIYLIR